MSYQLSILSLLEEGEQRRDKGMQVAIDHADAVVNNWSNDALELLKEFLKITTGDFMAEDFRSYCAVVDFPLPPSARAFGHVIRKAANMQLIQFVRYGKTKNPKAHTTPASVWRAKR